MLGLKRGAVRLCQHESEWEAEAKNTISQLREILGPAITDIQHIGSTAIPSIKAIPIIDIAIAADRLEDILEFREKLENNGFYYRPKAPQSGQLLFACGSYYDGSGNLQTHFIHVVPTGSPAWRDYINFRDYLNERPEAAREYEKRKIDLAETVPAEGGRKKYLQGKQDLIRRILRSALVSSYLGKTVQIKIDRPLGSAHPRHADLLYPVNYGYIPDTVSGDGEELDVYLLGIEIPVEAYTGKIIGIIHRLDDVEDKLVAAPEGLTFNREEITNAVRFQEQYYQTGVETL